MRLEALEELEPCTGEAPAHGFLAVQLWRSDSDALGGSQLAIGGG